MKTLVALDRSGTHELDGNVWRDVYHVVTIGPAASIGVARTNVSRERAAQWWAEFNESRYSIPDWARRAVVDRGGIVRE